MKIEPHFTEYSCIERLLTNPNYICSTDKNKRLKTMYTILLLLEEAHERLQTAVPTELGDGSAGLVTSKHRHSLRTTTFSLPAF